MSILKEIYEYKLGFVEKQKKVIPQIKIENKISENKRNFFSFFKKLNIQNNYISIIGEIKKASPSLGKFVDEGIDLLEIAKKYEQNNVS